MLKLLEKIRASGFKLRIQSGKLEVAPAEKLSEEQIKFLQCAREKLIKEISETDSLGTLSGESDIPKADLGQKTASQNSEFLQCAREKLIQNHHPHCGIPTTMPPSQADIYNPNLRRIAQEKILQRLAQPQPLPVMQEFVGDDPVKQAVWEALTNYGVLIVEGTEARMSGLSLVAAIATFNATNQRGTA